MTLNVAAQHQHNHGAGHHGHGRFNARLGKKPKVIIVLPPSMRNINLQRLEYVAQDCLDDDQVSVKDLNVQFAWLADLDVADMEDGAPVPATHPTCQSVAAEQSYPPPPANAVASIASSAAARALTPLLPVNPPTTTRPTVASASAGASAASSSGNYRVFISNLHPDLPPASLRSMVPAGLHLVDLAPNPIRPIGPQKELVLSANFIFGTDADATQFMNTIKHATSTGDMEQYVVPGLRPQVSNPMPVAPASAAPPPQPSLPGSQPAPRKAVPVLSGYEPVGSWADDGSTSDPFARTNSAGPAARSSGPTQDSWGGSAATRHDSWGESTSGNGFDDGTNDWNGTRNGNGRGHFNPSFAAGARPGARGGDMCTDAGETSGSSSSLRGYTRNEREASGYGGGSARCSDRFGGDTRVGSDRLGSASAAGWESNAGGWDSVNDRTDRNAGSGGWDDKPVPAAATTAWDTGASSAWEEGAAGGGGDWATAADPWDASASKGGASAQKPAGHKKQGGGSSDEQPPIEKQSGSTWNQEPARQYGDGWNNVEPVQSQAGTGWNDAASVAKNSKSESAAEEPAAQQAEQDQERQQQAASAADFDFAAAPEDVDFDDQGLSFEAQTAGLDEQAPASFEDQTADLDIGAQPLPETDTEAAEPIRSPSPAKSSKSKSRSRSRSRSAARSPSPPRVKADLLTVTIDGMNPKAPSSQVLSLLGSHVPVDVIPTPMKRFGGPDGPQMRGAKFVFASEDEANAFIAHVKEMIEEGRTKAVEAPEIGLLIDWE